MKALAYAVAHALSPSTLVGIKSPFCKRTLQVPGVRTRRLRARAPTVGQSIENEQRTGSCARVLAALAARNQPASKGIAVGVHSAHVADVADRLFAVGAHRHLVLAWAIAEAPQYRAAGRTLVPEVSSEPPA